MITNNKLDFLNTLTNQITIKFDKEKSWININNYYDTIKTKAEIAQMARQYNNCKGQWNSNLSSPIVLELHTLHTLISYRN